MTTDDLTERARAEAERRWPQHASELRTSTQWLNEGMASGFVLGALWRAAEQHAERDVHALANGGCVPGDAYQDLSAEVARLRQKVASHAECHEDMGDRPCDRPAVAHRYDPETREPYPVCRAHVRGDMVPLAEWLRP